MHFTYKGCWPRYATLHETAGFTLIEIVVSMALLGLLLGGLYGLFAGSITAWQKAEQRAELEQNLRMVTRTIANDLENIAVTAGAALSGAGESEDSGGGFLQLTSTPTKPVYGSIVEILYQLTDAGLSRQVGPPSVLSSSGEAGPIMFENELLSPVVRKLVPSFLIEGEWQSELPTDEPVIPQAVRVDVWAGASDDEATWRQRTVEVNLRSGSTLQVGGSEQ